MCNYGFLPSLYDNYTINVYAAEFQFLENILLTGYYVLCVRLQTNKLHKIIRSIFKTSSLNSASCSQL